MCRTVLGIHDQAGPVLIRTSAGADKPSSQDMAVLGSMVAYAEGLGIHFGSVATDDYSLGFRRYSAGTVAKWHPELHLLPAYRVSPSLLMTLITSSKLRSEAHIMQFLQASVDKGQCRSS